LPAEVRRALAEGKLVDAIRLLRRARGLDLEAAKDLIDSVQRLGGGSAATTQRAPVANAGATRHPTVADADFGSSGLDAAGHELLARETHRARQGLAPGEQGGREGSLGSGLFTAAGILLIAWLAWRWLTGG
jgi:hypothetical protein